MNVRTAFFHYRQGNTILHKMPPAPKTVLMLILSLMAFYVPVLAGGIIYCILIFLAFFYFKLSFRELFSDNKPAIFYALMLFIFDLISNIAGICKNGFENSEISLKILQILKPDSLFGKMSVQVFLSLQITSLFFRATTVVQLTEGFSAIEHFFTRKDKTVVADVISLTLTFIPRLMSLWQELCFAWKNRAGKDNPRKLKILCPFLIKRGMHCAWQKSMAKLNRSR